MQASINIAPYNFGPGKTATKFVIKAFNGAVHDTVTFACAAASADVERVLDDDGVEVTPAQPGVELSQHMVQVSPEQWNTWTEDDDAFFATLATIAGFTPTL